jgi:hypothetical protein
MGHAKEAMVDTDVPASNRPHPLGFVELGYILVDRLLRLRERDGAAQPLDS